MKYGNIDEPLMHLQHSCHAIGARSVAFMGDRGLRELCLLHVNAVGFLKPWNVLNLARAVILEWHAEDRIRRTLMITQKLLSLYRSTGYRREGRQEFRISS